MFLNPQKYDFSRVGRLKLNTKLGLGTPLTEKILAAIRERDGPHAIAFYLRALAGEFHSYYNAERILVEDETLRAARLALCAAVRQTLANGLALLGVSAPEKM